MARLNIPDFPTLLGCPWDGQQPAPFTWKAGCHDEPVRMVALRCTCGAQRAMEIPEEGALRDQVEQLLRDHRHLTYERACMIVGVIALADAWNTRMKATTR